MVEFNRHDLEFILQQILIAEQHAAGADLADLIPNPLLPWGLRTVDGTYNNIIPGRENFGAADQTFPRLLDPQFLDGDPLPFDPDGPGPLQAGDPTSYDQTSGLVFDSQPRLISNLIVDQTANNPAAVAAAAARDGSMLLSSQVENGNFEAAFQSAPTVTALGDFTVGGIQGWTTTGSAGLFDPTAGSIPQLPGVDAGNKVAFANVGGTLRTTIGQFESGQTFDITFDVYTRTDSNPSTFNVEIFVGGVSLGIQQGTGPATGGAATASFSFDPTSIPGLTPGANVELAITAASGGQLDIDNVSAGSGLYFIPNQAPDEGISAPFNSWMTLFGQFFDHGLDLVTKGGGTVFVPLAPDDPLYDPASPTNFMVLTRATNQPGPDGVLGTQDDIREHTNTTTPFVDQNQTYTSHPSHHVFLREYIMRDGLPVSTGHLLEGANGGLATWAEIKEQAREMLGIDLTDAFVTNVPLLATDAYGAFLRGPNGLPQVVMDDGNGGHILVEGVLPANGGPLDITNAIQTGHAFLDDIAHAAAPFGDHDGNPSTPNQLLTPDADTDTGGSLDPTALGEYDNELLDRHFITGDGRGNENIGLTTVHHVFHSEHNRLAEHTKDVVIASGDIAFINQWLLTPIEAGQIPTTPEGIDALDWSGERLFQSARFGTEMQYQHLVFEEFARKVNPMVDLFVFNPTMDVDPAIFAEFAHVVYRFGHSMLTESIDRLDATGQVSDDIGLIEAFLNPIEFDKDGTITADQAAGAVVRGMTRQTGNEIDEFVTEALRNNLLGLPLDLATINIARARDAGVPSLNAARAEFYEMTRSEWLKPYTSWVDFAQNLKNPASVINFIAAYGTHASITAETTAEGKRDAATALVLGGVGAPADRLDFLNGRGAYADLGGLNAVDFWIGGLAESILPFGGMLGSTFTFVFEMQLENLQNGDRFYYLSRTQGLHFLQELENNAFSKLIMSNTDLGEENATHLPGEIFARVDHILEIDQALQREPDPVHDDPILAAIEDKVARDQHLVVDGITYQNSLKFTGGEHVVLGGSEQDDVLIGDLGDDTIWGDGGNDLIIGGHGINRLHGGSGDDIIYGGGDPEFIHGDDGNDVIHGGNGLGDLIFPGKGNDFVIGGIDGKEVFGAEGTDFILGSPDVDFLLGGEGNDWIEGGEGFDTIAGDNSELFFNSTVIGHDVLFAGTNENDFDAESGDDIMVQGESVMRNEGMLGFDWVSFEEHLDFGADADMRIKIFTTVEADILRNRFDRVEAMSGSKLNDIMIGDDRFEGVIDPLEPAALLPENIFVGDELTREGAERIDNLAAVLAPVIGDLAQFGATENVFGAGNILLGGDGSDTIQGGGGDDIIDGDKWLNVRIGVTGIVGGEVVEIGTADKMQGAVHFYTAAEAIALNAAAEASGIVTRYGEANAALQAREGTALDEFMFDRTLNPSQLSIVREILNSNDDPNSSVTNGNVGDLDTAVFQGSLAEYTVRDAGGNIVDLTQPLTADITGLLTVEHTLGAINGGGILNDGTDTLTGIERLQFADRTIELVGGLNELPIGAPAIQALTDIDGNLVFQAGLPLRIATNPDGSLFNVTDPNNPNGGLVTNFSVTWQIEDGPGTGIFIDALATGLTFTPSGDPTVGFDGERVRALVSFVDANGIRETVATTPSGPLAPATDLTDVNGDLLFVGSHAIPNTPANQAFGISLPLPQSGTDSIVGGANADELRGLSGNDVLEGNGADDVIDAGSGDDTLNGGAGSDTLIGGDGTDIAIMNAASTDATFFLTPSGSLEIVVGADEDELIDIEQVQFSDATLTIRQAENRIADFQRGTGAGETLSGTAAVDDTIRGLGGADTINGLGGDDLLLGDGGADTLNGGAGDDLLAGGAGNDTVNGGGGDDTIFWYAGDGRDVVNGGAGVDILSLNGDESLAETFRIYTRQEAVAAGLNVGNTANEIIITRTVDGAPDTNADRIALIRNIEELEINTRTIAGATIARGDTVEVIGDFTGTSLALNTITINGSEGDDTIDITALQSAHRVVFKSNGGHDTLIGNLRPQDVIELPQGTGVTTQQDNANGTKTITFGTSSITFTAASVPTIVGGIPSASTGHDLSFTASDISELLNLVKGIPSSRSDEQGATGIRDLEGTSNNVIHPNWGSADEPFIRITEARYGTYDAETGNLAINPIFNGLDARAISNILGHQEDGLAKNDAEANILFMAFGQYFDHGLDFLPKGGNGTLQIGGPGSSSAPGSDNPADLTRGTVANAAAVANGATPEHINKTSPFVDQNQAYGSTELVGQFLRESDGNGGFGARLFAGGPDPSNPEFNLLPTLRELILHHWENDTTFVDASLPNGQVSFRDYYSADGVPLVDGAGNINELMAHALNSNFMGSGHTLVGDANGFINILDHFVAGDLRANENYTLTSIHTIWARNHNYHVEKLAEAGFAGDAEELFQAAKIVNEAEYQKVVFGEFADYLLGGLKGSGHHGHDEYNPDAFQFDPTPQDPNNGDTISGQAAIDALAQHQYFPQPGYQQLGVNAVLGGIAQQQAEEVDFNIVDAVRNDLVRIRADLFAFNVTRGWDVGLGTLNQVRADLLASTDPYVQEAISLSGENLNPYASWDDFQQRNGLSDAVIAQFKEAYPDLVLGSPDEIDAFQAANPNIELIGGNTVKGIDRVDLWVGGLAEAHINGGMVGSTFWVVLHEQFDRLQEGDRFYYIDRVGDFDFYQLSEEQSFADIIARNTGLTGLDSDVFRTQSPDDDNSGQSGNDTTADDTTTTDDNVDTGTGTGTDTGGTGQVPVAETVAGVTLHGDADDNNLFGGEGSDMIDGGQGHDVIIAMGGDDTVAGGSGDDIIDTGAGNDLVFGNSGNDTLNAGAGDDVAFGGSGRDRISGGSGDDVVDGGQDRDVIDGGDGDDTFIASMGDGDDVYHGGSGVDTLDMEAITSNITVDLGSGGFADNTESGFDTIDAIENFKGGAGHDTIIAGSSVNVMAGGAGNDTFVFNSVSAANGDEIVGFSHGDTIDLSGLATSLGYDAGFTLVTAGSFNAAGQIQFRVEGGDSFLEGNINNDNSADFSIKIVGRTDLTEQDFA